MRRRAPRGRARCRDRRRPSASSSAANARAAVALAAARRAVEAGRRARASGGRQRRAEDGAGVGMALERRAAWAVRGLYVAALAGRWSRSRASTARARRRSSRRSVDALAARGIEAVAPARAGRRRAVRAHPRARQGPGAARSTRAAEALLYAAARAQLVEERVRAAARRRRSWVLLDRFVDSSLAYQGAGARAGRRGVRELNAFATGGLAPDRTLLLRIDPAAGRARLAGRGEAPDRLERGGRGVLRARSRAAYDELAARRARADPGARRRPAPSPRCWPRRWRRSRTSWPSVGRPVRSSRGRRGARAGRGCAAACPAAARAAARTPRRRGPPGRSRRS